VTGLPPGISQSQVKAWDAAVSNIHSIAIANTNLRQAVMSVHQTMDANGKPLLDGSYYTDILTAIGKIDQVENAAAGYLQATPKNWSPDMKVQIANYMNQISLAINQLIVDNATGISNPASQKQVTTLVNEMTSIVKIVLAI
jgi:hypothetical protein